MFIWRYIQEKIKQNQDNEAIEEQLPGQEEENNESGSLSSENDNKPDNSDECYSESSKSTNDFSELATENESTATESDSNSGEESVSDRGDESISGSGSSKTETSMDSGASNAENGNVPNSEIKVDGTTTSGSNEIKNDDISKDQEETNKTSSLENSQEEKDHGNLNTSSEASLSSNSDEIDNDSIDNGESSPFEEKSEKSEINENLNKDNLERSSESSSTDLEEKSDAQDSNIMPNDTYMSAQEDITSENDMEDASSNFEAGNSEEIPSDNSCTNPNTLDANSLENSESTNSFNEAFPNITDSLEEDKKQGISSESSNSASLDSSESSASDVSDYEKESFDNSQPSLSSNSFDNTELGDDTHSDSFASEESLEDKQSDSESNSLVSEKGQDDAEQAELNSTDKNQGALADIDKERNLEEFFNSEVQDNGFDSTPKTPNGDEIRDLLEEKLPEDDELINEQSTASELNQMNLLKCLRDSLANYAKSKEQEELGQNATDLLNNLEQIPSFEERQRSDGYALDTKTNVVVDEIIIQTLIKKFLTQQFCRKQTDLNLRSDAYERAEGMLRWDIHNLIIHLKTDQIPKIPTDKYGYEYGKNPDENIPLSFYFDLSGSMSAYTAMLASVAIELLKNNVKVLVGYNEEIELQIDKIDAKVKRSEIEELITTNESENPNIIYKEINKDIDDYLIAKQAEKVCVFSDFDPRAEIINLSTKARVYWFCFESEYAIEHLTGFKGFAYPVKDLKTIAEGLIKVKDQSFKTLIIPSKTKKKELKK